SRSSRVSRFRSPQTFRGQGRAPRPAGGADGPAPQSLSYRAPPIVERAEPVSGDFVRSTGIDGSPGAPNCGGRDGSYKGRIEAGRDSSFCEQLGRMAKSTKHEAA